MHGREYCCAGMRTQPMARLIGAVCMGVVVGVPLQPEDDGVGEEPVAIPGVLCCCPLHTATISLPPPHLLSTRVILFPGLTLHLLPQTSTAARSDMDSDERHSMTICADSASSL